MEKQKLNPDTELKDEDLDKVTGGRARTPPITVPPFSDEGSDEGKGNETQNPNN